MLLSFLAAVLIYNAHWLVYRGGPDLSVVSNEVRGHFQYFVGDIDQPSPRNVQRLGIQIALAQLMFVWCWFYVNEGKPWAVATGLWFLIQGAQVIWTGNLLDKEWWPDLLIFTTLMTGAYLWNYFEVPKKLKVVWSKRWIQ